jgi:hypothetical protein
MERHARQSRLAGVGAEGQARIEAASVDVPLRGFAGEVAARYLAGAGVGSLRVPDEAVGRAARAIDARVRVVVEPSLAAGAVPVPAGFEDRAAADLAAGALHALRALNACLQGLS